jgi:hypothetical protein
MLLPMSHNNFLHDTIDIRCQVMLMSPQENVTTDPKRTVSAHTTLPMEMIPVLYDCLDGSCVSLQESINTTYHDQFQYPQHIACG